MGLLVKLAEGAFNFQVMIGFFEFDRIRNQSCAIESPGLHLDSLPLR
jgi:hypothetical protein